jgi:hypothetical protein
MPPYGCVGCYRGITALREHACTQDAKAHNRYATNYIRLPSVSKQSPLPLCFFLLLLLHSYIQQLLVVDMELKKLPNQIRKKSWQSEWTFLLPPICNRISDVFFTQHFRTSSSSLPWAQYHVIVFPLIYVFPGNLSTLRHCNIQREYQNLNRNPLPSPSPAPRATPQTNDPGIPQPETAAVLDRQTDREFKIKRAVANSPLDTRPLTDAQNFFPRQNRNVIRKKKKKSLLAATSFYCDALASTTLLPCN